MTKTSKLSNEPKNFEKYQFWGTFVIGLLIFSIAIVATISVLKNIHLGCLLLLHSITYFILKFVFYKCQNKFLSVLPYSYSVVVYLLQALANYDKLTSITDSEAPVILTLLLVISTIIDKGFDTYKIFTGNKL